MSKQKKQKIKFSQILNFLNIFLFIIIILGSAYFVIGVNDLAIKGFALEELKIKSDQLNKKNKKNKMQIVELESYERLNLKIDSLDMVKINEIEYLDSYYYNNFMAKK